jgi:hypothetical protein
VKVRFWTDDIAEVAGEVVAKHGRTGGVVRMERNDAHGIKPGRPRVFNSLMEIPAAIERVLLEHGITLHMSGKVRKYIVD